MGVVKKAKKKAKIKDNDNYGLSAGDMEKLYEASIRVNTPVSYEFVHRLVVEQAMKLVGAKYGSFFALRKGRLRRIYSSDTMLKKLIVRRKGYTHQVYSTGVGYLKDASEISTHHPQFEGFNVGSDIAVNISYGDTCYGVISVLSSKGDKYTDKDFKLMEMYAPLAGLAIRNSIMRRKLNKSLADRDHFLSVASHEIKTPLTSIYANTQYLKKTVADDKQVKEEMVDKMLNQEERLIRLIEDLLDAGRIDRGKIEISMNKIELMDIIEKSVRDFESIYPSHNIEINKEVKGDILVRGNRDRLYQVFSNLLHNAGKYSQPNTRVIIHISYDGPYYQISIKDEGEGISVKDQKNLFRRYYRGSSNVKSGIGIGLYLVRKIVDAHRGEIEVESEPGKGSVFSVFLYDYNKLPKIG